MEIKRWREAERGGVIDGCWRGMKRRMDREKSAGSQQCCFKFNKLQGVFSQDDMSFVFIGLVFKHHCIIGWITDLTCCVVQ